MSTEQVLSISQRRPKNKKYDSLMVFVCLWLMVKTNIWLPHFCPRKRSVAKIEKINLLILGKKILIPTPPNKNQFHFYDIFGTSELIETKVYVQ